MTVHDDEQLRRRYPGEPPLDPEDNGAGRPLHHNSEAEQELLGSLLRAPELAPTLADALDAEDFYQPRHETLWEAIQKVTAERGHASPGLVLEHLQQTSQLRPGHLDGPYLHTLLAAAPNTPHAAHTLASTVLDAARIRRVATVGTKLLQLASAGDPGQIDDRIAAALDELDHAAARIGSTGILRLRHVLDIDEFLSQTEADYDWLVPGLLERGDRVILTGGEGSGKSTLGRQLGIQTAAGIHPFKHDRIPPINVLLLDLENSAAQLRRELGKLRARAGRMLDAPHMHVESRIAGLDLTTQDDRTWLRSVCAAARPDLLITGPIYKMAAGDPNKEEDTKPVALFLDQLRAEFGCAVWLEGHVGNEQPGSKRRPERPVGWSGWRRWPEFGLYLADDGELHHWRGDRDRRDWPVELMRGMEWPWHIATSDSEMTWTIIKECILDAGEMLSNREVANRTNISRATVNRTVATFSQHYQGLRYRLEADQEEQ